MTFCLKRDENWEGTEMDLMTYANIPLRGQLQCRLNRDLS